jgi:hypothetical protein
LRILGALGIPAIYAGLLLPCARDVPIPQGGDRAASAWRDRPQRAACNCLTARRLDVSGLDTADLLRHPAAVAGEVHHRDVLGHATSGSAGLVVTAPSG